MTTYGRSFATAVDRQSNKVIGFKISKDSNKNDKIICRQLLEEIKNNNNTAHTTNTTTNNNQTKINIIATDGNYSYDRVINAGYNRDCNKHIIDKVETPLVENKV